MAISVAQSPTWEDIDRAESYLVCCMFDESTALASSILSRLLENCDYQRKGSQFLENYENEWDDMLESAGMVFVQSMKQLQRTSEILKELKLLFGSVTAIPVQVFLTGVCFLMSEGLLTVAQGFLEEFLNNWRYVNQRYYLLSSSEANTSDIEGSCYRCSIGVDKYLEVVELYVVSLLAMAIKDIDLAISWVDKAMLPEEKRQELLRRLHYSMNSSKVNSSSQASMSVRQTDEYKRNSDPFGEQKQYNGCLKDFESGHLAGGGNTTKQAILKLSRHRVPYFWWFPTINLKLGSYRLVVPSGKVLLSCLLLLMYYFMRKKQAALKRVLVRRAVSIKKSLVDLWQLAFSYQMNPLAAVQPLPAATRGSH
ncbi:3-phosphoinositide-dependent protein kinase-1 [Abeliophyllum distichum]|uniref:3-phosphoinositide-dependent protein kinase-1 n=1 Tax=Abeliophyllum distichum TaxID=126358 RepID=A0ABD1V7P6_9LAMI